MGECGNEIEVNGKTYILKDSFKMSDNIVLVRTYSAGVHFGELVKREGKEVTLKMPGVYIIGMVQPHYHSLQ